MTDRTHDEAPSECPCADGDRKSCLVHGKATRPYTPPSGYDQAAREYTRPID